VNSAGEYKTLYYNSAFSSFISVEVQSHNNLSESNRNAFTSHAP